LAAEQLAEPGASPFFQALQREWDPTQFETSAPQNPEVMVKWFAECPAEQVQRLFWLVRGALLRLSRSAGDVSRRRYAEEAAAALYYLAACRLVNRAAHEARLAEPEACAYLVDVPDGEPVVCAVIAMALFGGQLRLKPSEEPRRPCPEYVFEVKVPAGGDLVATDFERALHTTLSSNKRETTLVSLDSKPLTGPERAWLEMQIGDLKQVHKRSIALVVYGLIQPKPCEAIINQYQVPTLLPTTEVTSILLGMSTDRLLAEVHKFWEALEVLSRPVSTPPAHSHPGAQPMPSTGQPGNFQVFANNVAISTGDHSASQAGPGGTAQVSHVQGADLSVLVPLLRELAVAIGELPSPKARDTLAAHVQVAEAEVAKKDQADPGALKSALDAIKPAAEVLEGGEKILTLCHKAYQVLAPFLGLPTLP
jgi:hypothetical protein